MNKKDDAFYSEKTTVKIGKTEYVVNSFYNGNIELFEKLLRLMLKDTEQN